ncbi:MAG: HAD family phosphatase [Candidatus Thermoplasmatota archaeon]|nr:HAD family phosphatase [Candidatus Thermoplasmatota archaeon]
MNGRKPLIIFDMDGVLVHERSSWRLVHDSLGTSNEISFQAYMRGEIDDLEFMRRDIRLWMEKGLTRREDIGRILGTATLMDGFKKCMTTLSDMGAELAIISGGLDLLAERLGAIVDFDHCIANGLAARDDGTLTGEGILRVPLSDKGSVLRKMLGNSGTYGPVVSVGDSSVDIPMFGPSDLSIAFRPEAKEVETAADVVVQTPDLEVILDILVGHLQDMDRG